METRTQQQAEYLHDIRGFVEGLDQLPSVSPVAVKLIQAATDPEIGIAEVAVLIESDQSLAARILKIANSAGFCSSHPVNTIGRATSLLGLEMLRSVALSAIVVDLFKDQDERGLDLAGLWRHSASCAIASEVVARKAGFGNPQEAFLAGLLHDVGKLVLHTWNAELYAGIVRKANDTKTNLLGVEEDELGAGHTWVAHSLLSYWKFPASLREAAWLHHQPILQNEFRPGENLASIVQFANSICHHFRFGVSGNPICDTPIDHLSRETGWTLPEILDIAGEVLNRYDEVAAQFDWEADTTRHYLKSLSDANRELSRINLELDVRSKQLLRRQQLCGCVNQFDDQIHPPVTVPRALEQAVFFLDRAVSPKGVAAFMPDPKSRKLEGRIQFSSGGAIQRISVDWPHPSKDPHSLSTREQVSLIIEALRLSGDDGNCWHLEIGKLLKSPDLIVTSLEANGRTIGQVFVDLESHGKDRRESIELTKLFARRAALLLDRILLFEELDLRAERLAQLARSAESSRAQLFNSERLASVGRLAAGAAHEINNPLTIVSAHAQLLLGENPNENQQHALETIVEQSDRIAKIVRDLMGLARPAKPRVEETSLKDLISRVTSVLENRLQTAGVVIQEHFSPNTPSLPADPQQLEQVLINLVVNAIQAMPGGGLLTISCGPDKTGEYVQLLLRDDGPGIAPDNLESIFDPFFSTKGEGEGMGLGLAICHSIVEAHGGQISVESRPTDGTTFTITLPVLSRARREPITQERRLKPETSGIPKSSRRVLLIDDEIELNCVLAESLRRQGYEASTAASPEVALESLSRGVFDLAVLDIRMPGVAGLDLLKSIKLKHPELPVVIFTGATDEGQIESARKAGAAECLRKPIETSLLAHAITTALADKEA